VGATTHGNLRKVKRLHGSYVAPIGRGSTHERAVVAIVSRWVPDR
jgi:hypothetical protein